MLLDTLNAMPTISVRELTQGYLLAQCLSTRHILVTSSPRGFDLRRGLRGKCCGGEPRT